ncbi:MAG: glycosyltransferase family 4 protein [candidate division Zixibacteria bacterium]|nr:glycosyltransferase family 4 protein [candidate division Zixibacteria bacterium]
MNILIVAQHFPPERGAVRRLFEFARYFVRSGNKVSVLTAIPNYPDGVVPEKYRGRFFYTEEMDGVKVYRSWVLAASNRDPGKRMIGFVTFLFSCLINSFRVKEDFDLILASTPPVNTPVIGWMLSKIRRTKLIIEIRDLQPESSEDFGNLNRSLFTRTLKKMMHGLYRRADKIVAATDGIASYVKSLGIPAERVETIKSGYSETFTAAHPNGIRKSFGWEDKFLILYSGTLGWAHSLETVIESARQLTDQPDVQFVFVGEGEKRNALEGMVRDYGLKNVTFIGSQPLEKIPYFLKASDALIESLREVPITKGTFPAKLFEYMATGRPILFGSSRGEAINELEEAGGALRFGSDDADSLSALILKLKNGEIDGERLGRSYQAHAERFHPRERWAHKYLTFLDSK